MSKNKKTRKIKSPFNLNVGIIIFGLISIYLVINLAIYFTTERTNYYEVVSGTSSEEAYKSYTGIAIRDEKIAYAKTTGYIDYYVRECSRVSKKTTLYSIDSTGKLNNIISEAGGIDSEKLTSSNITTLLSTLNDYSNNYDDMNFSEVYNFKTIFRGTVFDLLNMNSLTKVAKKKGTEFSINKSSISGIVLYRVDDFETLTPKQLEADYFDKNNYICAKFASGDKVENNTPIYKTINDEEWSIAIQLNKQEAKQYKKTTGVKIKFLKDNINTTANMEVVKGSDGNNYGIITLSKYVVRYATDRFINIQISNEISTGLKIPKTSLVTKNLYVIPKRFGGEGGDSSNIGFNRQIVSEGKITSEFYYPTIAYSDENNYYVSTVLFDPGDVLTAMDSNEQYTIGQTREFVGVYNINNGYTVFVRVNIISSTDEYYIVESEDNYGLLIYDRIVLDSSQVKENQIIFQ